MTESRARTEAPSPSLARVARGNLCAGCGACAMIAPERVSMKMEPPGFLRPRQSGALTETEERLISQVCPGLGQTVDAGERRDHALWGPYLEMRAGHSTDPGLRFDASSGGALSALLVHLLAEGEVDGVIQTRAAEAPPYANTPTLSTKVSEICEAAGSRYAPSAPLAGLGASLGTGRRFAFVGKPCDVAALRALSRQDPHIAETFPVVLSFFCAGVPSQTGAEEVARALGLDPSGITAFRYRGRGWPGQATATRADGVSRSMSYAESWGGILSRHVQHRCKICADGTGKAADIVCADAWQCDEQGYPVFEERDGVSLVVARTKTGQRLLAAAEAAGRLETTAFDPRALARMQPGQFNRRTVLLARLAALRLFGKPVPRYRGLRLGAAARQAAPRAFVKNFAGMARRILRGRAP
ncbi:Coenzyme F420 hydrogenase/dehydrogenase, beta subunit C-terminal domain [Rhodosalinus sp. K401]|uniref:Coenzyme F420 hydrogenase/dehydrogenase, beta subunit C-terminal domain n=1 Tax=Rhodosalinus sp. K401 TaxID=3239195 RepID=UPI00352348E0